MAGTSPSKSMRDYEAEDDARTLMRAHEISQDTKRHGRANKALAKIQADAAKTQERAKAVAKMKQARPR